MKKIIFVLFLVLNISKVYANETINITDDVEVKYKWYKEEIIDELYHKKGEDLEGYLEDTKKIKSGLYYTVWDGKYCTYSEDDYYIERDIMYEYNNVENSMYIKLEKIDYQEIKKIQIFYKNKELEYNIIQNNNEQIIIKLNKYYETNYLWFYIDTEKEYDITLAYGKDFNRKTISKHIKNEKLLVPDKSWINEETKYVTTRNGIYIENDDFLKLFTSINLCRVKEKLTYRYKINKVYYDDNYHSYIEGYLPDYNDYIIEYNSELPTDIVEITKTIVDKQKEYIYIENEKNKLTTTVQEDNKENILNQNECNKPNTVIETKYIENDIIKKIYKIPKKIYLLITILLLIITIQTIRLKKKVEKKI